MVLTAMLIAAVLVTGGVALELGSLRVSASRVRNPVALLWWLAIVWLVLRCRVVVTRAGARAWRDYVGPLGAAFGVAFILVLPLTIAAIRLLASGDYVSPPHAWRSGPRGVDLLTIVLGHPLHGQRDVYARFGIDVMEQSAWPGLIALALVAAILLRRVRLEQDARRWAWVAGIFLIWSCGAYLAIAGADTGLPMPQALARFAPIVSNARMPGRAFAVVQLALAVMVAIAAARAAWKPAVVAALTAVAFLDGFVSIPLYHLPESGALEARVRSAAPQAVVELPVGIRDGFGESGRFDHRALVFQIAHGQPIAGGFVARLSPRTRQVYESSTALKALMDFSRGDRADLPATAAADLLALGVTQTVVNTDAMPRAAAATRAALEAAGFTLVMVEGTRELYLAGGAP
jgi:hypothetical protein